MINKIYIPAAELLSLEEKHLYYFLTGIRPVGEEKSELYPEPQYFYSSFVPLAAQLPETLRLIVERAGSVDAYAKGLKTVLSKSTALHLSGLPFLSLWGREMWLLDEPQADLESGVIIDGSPTLSDQECANVLRFGYDVTCRYRNDGNAFSSLNSSLGSDYCILGDEGVAELASMIAPVCAELASDVLGLLAVVRSLSFLMEAETREALMMHGPYKQGDNQLIVFECTDLHWSLFSNFPLPNGVRWQLPVEPFPYANLAIVLELKDVNITADRFGTLYFDSLVPENVVSAALLTRGVDEFIDEGLGLISLQDTKYLRRKCDELQEFLFFQIACWEPRQRMAAGVYQEHLLPLRMLAAAGYSRAELEAYQENIHRVSEPILTKYFEKNFNRSGEELPFYQKLGAFVQGGGKGLFTQFSENTK